jgi:hypothetical protein
MLAQRNQSKTFGRSCTVLTFWNCTHEGDEPKGCFKKSVNSANPSWNLSKLLPDILNLVASIINAVLREVLKYLKWIRNNTCTLKKAVYH